MRGLAVHATGDLSDVGVSSPLPRMMPHRDLFLQEHLQVNKEQSVDELGGVSSIN